MARRIPSLLRNASPRVVDRLVTRDNSFDALRLIAALAVIVSHAYPLSGDFVHEPGVVLTRGQVNLGEVAVDVFFIISGFLITRSFLRSGRLGVYAWSRVLRIVPGLVLSTLITAFVIGPLMTTLPLRSYLTAHQTYAYLLTAALPYNQTNGRFLPGVFAGNIVANTVNGSLWTIEGEVLCYVAVGVLGVCRGLRPSVVAPLLAALVVLPFAHPSIPYPWIDYLDFGRFFAAGSLLYLWRDRVPVDGRLAVGALTLIVTAVLLGHGLGTILVPTLSYLVVWFALTPRFRVTWTTRSGDFSYGTYLYAFPVQQAVVHVAGGAMMPWLNVVFSAPLTLICAALSWHLIEKRALAWKARPLVAPVRGEGRRVRVQLSS